MQLDVAKTPSGFLKVLEIVLSIIIVCLTQSVDGFTFGNMQRTVFCGGVLVTSLVVTPLLLLTYLSGHAREIQRTPFELLFNAVLAVFMLSAGAVTINTSMDLDGLLGIFIKASRAGKAAGSLGIVNSLFYGLDTFFARQNME